MTNSIFGAIGAAEAEASKASEAFSLDLERFWIQARTIKYWLLGLFALSILLGIIATLLTTPQYQATSRIEISLVEQNITDSTPLESDNRFSAMSYMTTQIELLKSPFVVDRMIDAGNLTRDPEFLSALGFDGAADERAIKSALRKGMSVEDLQNSTLIDLTFSSPSPVVSAKIANLWAQEFLAANYEKRFGTNIEAREFLEQQIEELRERLALSERSLIDYATANEIIILESAGENGGSETAAQSLVGTELAALSEALAKATGERIRAESALKADARSDAASAPTATLRNRLAEARAQLAELKSRFGPGYPEIKAKEAEVASLAQALSGENSLGSRALQATYRKAMLEEQGLRAKLNQSKAQFLGQQGQGIQYGILKREVDTNRQLYDALLQRYKELEAAGAGKNNMTLIDPAVPPISPYSPSLIRNLLIALALATISAALIVYLREMMDQTVRDPADVSRRLGITPLGLIPRVEDGNIVTAVEQRSSEISEAYAAARTNMAFLTPNGAPRAIMLTSTRPNEGKSISSVALARSFAQLGKKVLLIDADLRHSGLSDFIGIDADPAKGLSALLTGNNTINGSAIPIAAHGFDLLPTGHKPPNPVELLAGPGLKRLIDEALETYDQVLVDGAPVLGLADALEVSKATDGVVFVVESNGANIRAINNAITRLRSANATIFGALVTKLDQRNSTYGFGYGYGYGYGYGDNEGAQAGR